MTRKNVLTVFLLLALVIVLRLPSLFEPYWHGDEGITLTVGQSVRNGAILYKNVADNKTPLLYFLASIFYTLQSFRLLLFIWTLASTVVFYFIAKILLKTRGILLSLLVFILLTSTPYMDGNIANGEIFFILPNLLGIYLFLKGFQNNKILSLVFSGIFFGIGFLFKVPAIFDFIGIILLFSIYFINKPKKMFISLLSLITGFILPNFLIVLFFYFKGAINSYWQYAFLWNFTYSSWNNNLLIPYGNILVRVLPISFVIIFIFIKRFVIKPFLAMIILWFSFSLFGSYISARGYIHYFLPIVPPLSLVLGKLFNYKKNWALIIIILIISYRFFRDPGSFQYQISYYNNYWKYALGKEDIISYRNFFDPNTNRTYKIADYLKTAKSGKIFIWGDDPLIYSLSQRGMVGKFSTAYNINWEENRKVETFNNLKSTPPVYILYDKQVKFNFYKLDNFINEEYNFVKDIDGVRIYERKV